MRLESVHDGHPFAFDQLDALIGIESLDEYLPRAGKHRHQRDLGVGKQMKQR